MDIALSYREIASVLSEITEAMRRHDPVDIRDVFGRRQDGLELGVPSGRNAHRLFNVPWTLAKPIIEANIAHHRSVIAALNEKARVEIDEEWGQTND